MKPYENLFIKEQVSKVVPIKRIIEKDQIITVEVIKQCQRILAIVIQKYGKLYLPVFQRLEEEIKSRELDRTSYEKALQIAENKLL